MAVAMATAAAASVGPGLVLMTIRGRSKGSLSRIVESL